MSFFHLFLLICTSNFAQLTAYHLRGLHLLNTRRGTSLDRTAASSKIVDVLIGATRTKVHESFVKLVQIVLE